VVKERRIAGSLRDVVAECARFTEPFRVCFEASIGYGTLHDGLAALPLCRSVSVAHPGQLRLIFRSKKKNDRVDARKLAMLMLLGQVPTVHVPSIDVRGWRLLVEHRRRMVDQRTMAKNSLRSILRTHAIRPAKGLWGRKGVAWHGTSRAVTVSPAHLFIGWGGLMATAAPGLAFPTMPRAWMAPSSFLPAWEFGC